MPRYSWIVNNKKNVGTLYSAFEECFKFLCFMVHPGCNHVVTILSQAVAFTHFCHHIPTPAWYWKNLPSLFNAETFYCGLVSLFWSLLRTPIMPSLYDFQLLGFFLNKNMGPSFCPCPRNLGFEYTTQRFRDVRVASRSFGK